MKYYIDTISNHSKSRQPLPGFDDNPVFTRATAIEGMEKVIAKYLNNEVRKVLKPHKFRCGISFEYNGETYPIVGYDGYIPFSKLLSNRVIEYDIYKSNGWINGFTETEQIYSITTKEYVTVLKHNPEVATNLF